MKGSKSGAGNLKALLAAGLTAGLMFSVLDIRGVRRPEWLRSRAVPQVPETMKDPGALIKVLRKRIDDIRSGKTAPTSENDESPEIDRAAVERFLDGDEAAGIITHPATHGSWYFLKPEWLDRDVVKVPYEDGTRGGILVVKVVSMHAGIPEMKILWDSLLQ